jgi:hypothetical protein
MFKPVCSNVLAAEAVAFNWDEKRVKVEMLKKIKDMEFSWECAKVLETIYR